MAGRTKYPKAAPDLYKAMLSVEATLHAGSVEIPLLHPVELRASQFNRCAFCIDMHWKDAKAVGEVDIRISTLDAWHESPFYSQRKAGSARSDRSAHPNTESTCARYGLRRTQEALRREADRGTRLGDFADQRVEPHRDWIPCDPGCFPARETRLIAACVAFIRIVSIVSGALDAAGFSISCRPVLVRSRSVDGCRASVRRARWKSETTTARTQPAEYRRCRSPACSAQGTRSHSML